MKAFLITVVSFTQILFGQPKAKAEVYFFNYTQENKLALKIDLVKDWHLYWFNSGDSGIPTEIKWELPEGISITQSHWAIPKAFETEGLVSYGYENTALILFDVLIQSSNEIYNKVISCKINSLICKDVCIPFDTTITFKLSDLVTDADLDGLIKSNQIKFPERNNDILLNAFTNDYKVVLELSTLYSNSKIREISVFPFENGIFKNVMKNSFIFNSNKYYISLYFDPFKTFVPEIIEGLLIIKFEEGDIIKTNAYEISVRL